MRIVQKSLVFMAAVIAMVSLSSIANALPQYLAALQAKYPNTTTITCGVCHTTQDPTTPPNTALNPYGLAFQARRHNTVATRNNALTFIERLDSDGDGFTNLTEITATTARIKILPGFATANAAFPRAAGFRPVPPRLLFFDNFSNAALRSVPNWRMRGGVWSGVNVAGNIILTSPLPAVDTLALITPPNPLPATNFGAGTIEVQAQLVVGDQPDIVFAWTPADHRFVGISGNEITIGQDSVAVETRILNAVFGDLQPHLLRIVIGPQTARGSLVTVFVDGTRIGAHRFARLANGQVGFRTQSTRARFDNMRVSR